MVQIPLQRSAVGRRRKKTRTETGEILNTSENGYLRSGGRDLTPSLVPSVNSSESPSPSPRREKKKSKKKKKKRYLAA